MESAHPCYCCGYSVRHQNARPSRRPTPGHHGLQHHSQRGVACIGRLQDARPKLNQAICPRPINLSQRRPRRGHPRRTRLALPSNKSFGTHDLLGAKTHRAQRAESWQAWGCQCRLAHILNVAGALPPGSRGAPRNPRSRPSSTAPQGVLQLIAKIRHILDTYRQPNQPIRNPKPLAIGNRH